MSRLILLVLVLTVLALAISSLSVSRVIKAGAFICRQKMFKRVCDEQPYMAHAGRGGGDDSGGSGSGGAAKRSSSHHRTSLHRYIKARRQFYMPHGDYGSANVDGMCRTDASKVWKGGKLEPRDVG